jgi:hypothetical protein
MPKLILGVLLLSSSEFNLTWEYWFYWLRGTVLYPIPTDQHQRSLSKAVQAEDYPELKYSCKFPRYRTQKFNNPYKFYGFWNTYVQQVYRVPGGLQLLSKISDRIDLPTCAYRKVLWESWNPQSY